MGLELQLQSEVGALPEQPQRNAVWHCIVHKLRTWAAAADGTLVRPHLILVVCVGSGAILTTTDKVATAEGATNIFRTPQPPSTAQVLRFLSGVMTAPRLMNTSNDVGTVGPGRPTRINFADTATAALLLGEKDKWDTCDACAYVGGAKAALASHAIACSFAPVPPGLMRDIIRGQIEQQFPLPEECSGLSLMPGLRQEEGFTTPFGASLFAAATALWRADPWTAIPAARRRPIKVTFPLATDQQGNTFKAQGFAVLLGDPHNDEGDQLGMALYKREDLAWAAAQAHLQVDVLADPSVSGQSVLFMPAQEMPFEDLDELEQYGWTVPSDTVFPLFAKFQASAEGEGAEDGAVDTMTMTRPGLLDLMWFELAAHAVVKLLTELSDEDAADVSMALGPWTVSCNSCAAKGVPTEKEITVECVVCPP